MSRPLAVLALTTALAVAAPKVKEPAPVLYYPTKVGDTLVYTSRIEANENEWEYRVTAAEVKDGRTRVTMVRNNVAEAKTTVEVSAAGLTRVPSSGAGDAVPLL